MRRNAPASFQRASPSPILPAINTSQSMTQLPPATPSYVQESQLQPPLTAMTPIPPPPPGEIVNIPIPPIQADLTLNLGALQISDNGVHIPQPPPVPPPPPPPNNKPKAVPVATHDSSHAPDNYTSESSEGERMLNEGYVSNWVLVDSEIEKCKDDVKFIMTYLTRKDFLPTLIRSSPDFSPWFNLLLKQAMRSPKCSKNTRSIIATTLLDAGFIKLIKGHYENLNEQVKQLELDQHTKIIGAAQAHLFQMLTIVAEMISLNQPDLILRVFDEGYGVIFNLMQHDMLIELTKKQPSRGLPIYSSALSILNSFFFSPNLREQREQEIRQLDVEANLNTYIEILKNIDPRDSNSVLSSVYLTRSYFNFTNQGAFPQQPVRDMMSLRPTDENVSAFIKTAHAVRNRLCGASAANKMELIANPFLYFYDFWFMAKTAPVQYKCSQETKQKIFDEVIENGSWLKLLVEYYHQTIKWIEQPPTTKFRDRTRQKAFLMCALKNVAYGFNCVANGTDLCRNERLQQQMFDQLLDLIIKELTFQRLLKYMNLVNIDDAECILLGGLINSLLTIIHNFLFYYEPCIPVFRERGMMSIARNIRKNTDDSDIKTSALVIIAYLLIDSDDKEQMIMSEEELKFLIQEVEKSMFPKSQSDYHPAELINALNRIAVIDVNKLKLIDAGILPLLTKSLNPDKKYSPEHQEAAINAVWNLAFTEESKQKIIEQAGLMQALQQFKQSEHKGIRSALAGALWQLEGKEKHLKEAKNEEHKEKETDSSGEEKHIMLSYNHLSKHYVFAMRDMLRERGYKVWIDEDQITAGGSTLDAMSNAVENSSLVLIFFSEAYYKSKNCRAEGEYTFERNKPFLPIQVEPKYNPHGWLGLMCGSMYRYSMVKPDRYESDMASLFDKIPQMMRAGSADQTDSGPPALFSAPKDMPVYAAPALPAAVKLVKTPDCHIWSSEQVSEWIQKNGLQNIARSLEGMDGEMLSELALLSASDKDTFYNLLSKPGELIGILKLSKAIKKLALQ